MEWPEWKLIYGSGFRSRLRFALAGWDGFGAVITDEEPHVRGQHYHAIRKRECHIFRDELFCFHADIAVHPEFR